jgi:YD repeat-containing protein
VTIQFPDSTYFSYQYDTDGDVQQFTDRNLLPNYYFYDSADRLIKVARAYGKTGERDTSFILDAVGNRLSLTDNNGHKSIVVYNEQNMPRSTSDAVGVGYTIVYDGACLPLVIKDSKGVTRNFVYYKNNRIRSVLFNDGTPAISLTYDGNGNRTSMSDGIGLKTYIYDALNRLLTVNDTARNFNLAYTYDAVGNCLSSQNNKVTFPPKTDPKIC